MDAFSLKIIIEIPIPFIDKWSAKLSTKKKNPSILSVLKTNSLSIYRLLNKILHH